MTKTSQLNIEIINFQQEDLYHYETLLQYKINNKNIKNIGQLKENFRYLTFFDSYDTKIKEQYFFAIHNNNIIGYMKLSLNNFENFGDWICVVETQEKFRQMGVATQLYKALFQWLKQNNYKCIVGSSYTELGKNMENMIKSWAKKYKIYYIRPKEIEMVEGHNYYLNLIKKQHKSIQKIKI